MRQLDGKFAIDGDNIIKISNGEKIPDDEPVMLFRARDYLVLDLLWDYARASRLDGCTDYHLAGVRERIKAFERFKKEHPERMKQPGITRGK
jgi:hypothetical protein